MNFSLKKISKPMQVYDIQVANTHTFTVGTSHMVVHNCFLNYIEDTAEGLVDNLSETNWLSMLGGGVGIGFGIRSADDKSTGIMPHLKIYDASSLAYRQGRTRRGSYAAYLDISHPDIISFLEMRKPTGDPNVRCLNLHHGINITDDFMAIIEKCMLDPDFDDSWKLIDPNSKEVREIVSAKMLWQMILELRMHTGEPYIHYIDTSNRKLPQWLKDKGLKVHQSNLCLTGDTLVNVIIDEVNKTIRLDEVISLFNEGKDIRVESKNLNSGIVEYSQITNAAMTARNSQLILIEDEESGKSIRCTPEHKIYTKNRGYVMAKDLKDWLAKVTTSSTKESNARWSGYSDDFILEQCVLIFNNYTKKEDFTYKGMLETLRNKFNGIPKSFSKNRFLSYQNSFKIGLSNKLNIPVEELDRLSRIKSSDHKKSLSSVNIGNMWYSNDILKKSKQSKTHLGDGWYKGRNYGNKN